MYQRVSSALLGSTRRAWLTIMAWLVIAGVVVIAAPPIGEVQGNEVGGAPSGTPSQVAARELDEAFGDRDSNGAPPAIITISGDTQASTTSAAAAVIGALEDSSAVSKVVSHLCADPSSGLRPGPQCIPAPPEGTVAADGRTLTVTALMALPPGADGFTEAIAQLRTTTAQAAEAAAAGTTTHLTGPAGVANDLTQAFSEADWVLGLTTIVLVLVILLAVYRSPVLAVLPLVAVAVALMVANAVAAVAAEAGFVEVTAQSTSILTVLLFGVGTDYALIINARYREELATHQRRQEAMIAAMGRAGSALASSAGTIVLALLALLAATTPVLRGFGPYFAIGVAVMVTVAFSLLPALLVVLGDAVFWPGGRAKAVARAQHHSLWSRIAAGIDRAPAKILAGSLALLIALCGGLFAFTESYDIVSGLRVESDAKAGREVIAEHIAPGEVAPEQLLVTTQGAALSEDALVAAGDVAAETHPGLIDRVAVAPGASVSADGTVGRVRMVLATDPYSNQAMDSVAEASAAYGQALVDAGIDTSVVAAGNAGENRDIRASVHRDLLVLLPLLLVVVGAVLGVLLRSALAPLYLMALQAVGYAATMGATVIAAIIIGGDSGIGAQVPAYVLVFTIALGVDYTIFVMARYRQALADKPSRAALQEAITTTGGVVSSAGLILAATFSVLTVMPIRELFQFGIAMAIGILLDTFIIRPLTVPAIVRLLGDKALWPSESPHPQSAATST
ncbi:MMPL family transporter [Corynebacterium sp. TAE3-ERU12]|uniref:MMPL family transporter n=1 Tax=Corynebacterium sp. TAE3-ERU12 TaxID=2849491 RepID=UPI001C475ECB|nr:MMPL family transporter [Corynebacterium sp. TAE3-ERU12]MBV7295131.1 MMPL family transporter [Corynebacterium sp. TAE3-ERU12]